MNDVIRERHDHVMPAKWTLKGVKLQWVKVKHFRWRRPSGRRLRMRRLGLDFRRPQTGLMHLVTLGLSGINCNHKPSSSLLHMKVLDLLSSDLTFPGRHSFSWQWFKKWSTANVRLSLRQCAKSKGQKMDLFTFFNLLIAGLSSKTFSA